MPDFFYSFLNGFASSIARLQRGIAAGMRWLVLLMALLVGLVIVLRMFDLGSTALQESVSYLHAGVFMLCLAYTAQVDAHVRVDILYARQSQLKRHWINLFGTLFFLLPFAVFMVFISWHSAAQSWAIKEGSINPGGLPFLYLIKSLPVIAGGLLSLHALAELCRQLIAISVQDNHD